MVELLACRARGRGSIPDLATLISEIGHTCSLCRVSKLFMKKYLHCDTSYIVSVHIQCQASIYTLSLGRGHSWRVRLAKQETLTPPGHLVSPLVCRGPWMFTVVLYCWWHSDSASVRLYFTASKSRYGWNAAKATEILNKTNQPTNQTY